MGSLLINYADQGYYEAQKLNTSTGLSVGRLERAMAFGRKHLDAAFLARNRQVLDSGPGAGCWLWKPYVVVTALRQAMQEGELLFYADSGCHFVASAKPVIDLCRNVQERPVLLFSLAPDYLNRHFTKRDCFHYMGLDEPRFTDAIHLTASFFLCIKTPATLAFFEEWLRYAQDPRILTHIPNTCGLPDYPDFFQHRYDQSILSLLARKYRVATAPDISQWGNGRRPAEIPQIIAHTRWRA